MAFFPISQNNLSREKWEANFMEVNLYNKADLILISLHV